MTHHSFPLIQSVPDGQSSEPETITMPIDNHLIKIEPSIDVHTWEKREQRFRKKFEAGQKYAIEEILPSVGKNLLCKAANLRIF